MSLFDCQGYIEIYIVILLLLFLFRGQNIFKIVTIKDNSERRILLQNCFKQYTIYGFKIISTIMYWGKTLPIYVL